MITNAGHGASGNARVMGVCPPRGLRSSTASRTPWTVRTVARHAAHGTPAVVPALATTRRLQSLGWLGHGALALAAELGWSPKRVRDAQAGVITLVSWYAAETVSMLYDRWCWVDGGDELARTEARRAGWCSPLAWDDDELDDPAAAPRLDGDLEDVDCPVDRVIVEAAELGPVSELPLSSEQRAWLAVHLTRRGGLTASQIAGRLGLRVRQVRRYRAAARVAKAAEPGTGSKPAA
jgi:hypothetical protein